ncbi:MAG: class II glutamine amidotransferase, partial [Gammaproteobacteria bacterium]
MCGIVGAIADRDISSVLINGLKRLEYRGYDSAGIAVLDQQSCIQRVRTTGKIKQLEEALNATPANGNTGIGHTRWATHGIPSENNAHPHVCKKSIAVVHNGIIENFESLREEQRSQDYEFTSDTDTEVIVHQLHKHFYSGNNLFDSVRKTVAELEGAYALGVISTDEPGCLVAARRGSPLVIGIGDGENFIASDMSALLSETNRFIILDEGDIALITKEKVTVFDTDNNEVKRTVHE